MAKCVLKFKDVEIRTYPLTESSMTIGRNDDNDIVVSNMAVSGHHAKIDLVGNNFFLTDLQSMNGTYLNDHKIVSTKLTNNDKIIVGKHLLLFSMDEGEEEKSRSTQDFDQTMYLDTRKAKELRAAAGKGTKRPQKTGAPEKKRSAVLTYLAGGDGEATITKKLIKIGRDKTSDIVIHGMFVGSTAATISLRPSGYSITFAGGVAKLRINGKVVKGSLPLKEFDVIEIGSTRMQFYIK